MFWANRDVRSKKVETTHIPCFLDNAVSMSQVEKKYLGGTLKIKGSLVLMYFVEC